MEVAVDGRRFEASYFPVRAGGDDLVAVGAAVFDVEARRRAEDARERLQHATATLAATVTVADVARDRGGGGAARRSTPTAPRC